MYVEYTHSLPTVVYLLLYLESAPFLCFVFGNFGTLTSEKFESKQQTCNVLIPSKSSTRTSYSSSSSSSSSLPGVIHMMREIDDGTQDEE